MEIEAAAQRDIGRSSCVRVCKYWLSGNCNRNPCRFFHPNDPSSLSSSSPKHHYSRFAWKNPNHHHIHTPKFTNKKSILCKYWVTGNCVKGDTCDYLHSWFVGQGFTMLANLQGHTKVVTGIALPDGSDKLYSLSNDKTLRLWDCNTGQCAGTVDLGGVCGSLICEGPCLIVGLCGAVKVWNIQAQSEVMLNGVGGLVCAMAMGRDVLFAGLENGSILAWKTSCFEVPAVTLKGHSGAVLSIVVGRNNRLYSGSTDKTIKVWDCVSLQCLQTLDGHSDIVMSLLCWESFLLSGSLDGKIKVWATTECGKLEVVYEHGDEHGVLALCGIYVEGKPILLCSCNDNSVRLYDLPSFTERGRIFAKREVRALQIGTGGLFFAGDATGQITVWKLDGTASVEGPS